MMESEWVGGGLKKGRGRSQNSSTRAKGCAGGRGRIEEDVILSMATCSGVEAAISFSRGRRIRVAVRVAFEERNADEEEKTLGPISGGEDRFSEQTSIPN